MTDFYLKKIRIPWYGPLMFDNEINLEPGVNLIIGRNGSGKTQTLRMIEDASKGAQRYNPANYNMKDINEDQLVYLSLKDKGDPQSINFSKNGSWQNIDSLKDKIKFITSDRSIKGKMTTANPLTQFSDFAIPDSNNEINIVDEFNKALISELLRKVKELETEIPDLISEIEEHYQDGLVDFEKELKINFDRDNPAYFLDHRSREVRLQDLSSGEKEFLYFLAFLFRVKGEKNKIILIDEPELHLHGNQVRKLCELIKSLSLNNQVIISTHSGDILHYFMEEANIVLLNRGKVKNIKVSDEICEIVEQLGLFIDPSFFTSQWICAENDPSSSLGGESAPNTPEVLSWIFGKGREKKFWSFGSKSKIAESRVSTLEDLNLSGHPITLSIIFDGDRLIDQDNLPPEIKSNKYFPFWELENLFIKPEILDEVLSTSEKEGDELFWEAVNKNQEKIYNSLRKTIIKNTALRKNTYNYFKNGTVEELESWKEEISKISIDEEKIRNILNQLIANKNWKWIPGKEALSIVLSLEPYFWNKVRDLYKKDKLSSLIVKSDKEIEDFIESINSTIKNTSES